MRNTALFADCCSEKFQNCHAASACRGKTPSQLGKYGVEGRSKTEHFFGTHVIDSPSCGSLCFQAASAWTAKCREHQGYRRCGAVGMAVAGMRTQCAGEPRNGPTAPSCPVFLVPGIRSPNHTPFLNAAPISGPENGPVFGTAFVADRARNFRRPRIWRLRCGCWQ